MFGPREKLYLSSSLWYHMLIAVKSLMLSPALGWMLCMVAATTVFKVSLVMRESNNFDNFADSINFQDCWEEGGAEREVSAIEGERLL